MNYIAFSLGSQAKPGVVPQSDGGPAVATQPVDVAQPYSFQSLPLRLSQAFFGMAARGRRRSRITNWGWKAMPYLVVSPWIIRG